MLIQTKRIKDLIVSCGILRKDIKVITPFSIKRQGYETSKIYIKNDIYNKAKYILRLRKYFNLFISTNDKHEISFIIIQDVYVSENKKGKIEIKNIDEMIRYEKELFNKMEG